MDERNEAQVQLDKLDIERNTEDIKFLKERNPYEILYTRLNVINEEQQLYRRNIETLTALRKYSNSGELKNTELTTEIESKLLVFVKALRTTTLASDVK